MKYFAQCYIDAEKKNDIKNIRDTHLDYVKKFGSKITYGGICGNDEFPYQSICFFLNVNTENEALNFIECDPYYTIYSSVEIKEFTQKVPNLER